MIFQLFENQTCRVFHEFLKVKFIKFRKKKRTNSNFKRHPLILRKILIVVCFKIAFVPMGTDYKVKI